MQSSVDVCLPAAEADLAETRFPPTSDATCLGGALAPRQALTAAADEQKQAPWLLWVGEQLWHEPQEDGEEGTNPPAPATSQGSSTTQPQNWKPCKTGYIHPGLGPELPPHLNHLQPA